MNNFVTEPKVKMAKVSHADQFSLKWNNFSNTLTSGFQSHLNDKSLVDATICADGRQIHVHKLILSICSPYFRNIFEENPCQHPVIILKDIGYNEISALIKFMYEGETNIEQEALPNFLKVADTLQVRGLMSAMGDSGLCADLETNAQENNSISQTFVPHSSTKTNNAERTEPTESMKLKRTKSTSLLYVSDTKRRKSRVSSSDITEPTPSFQLNVQPKTELIDEDDDEVVRFEDESEMDPSQDNNEEMYSQLPEQELVTYNTEALREALIDASSFKPVNAGTRRNKNYPRLQHHGYIYYRNYSSSGRSYWKCKYYSKVGCKARCITEDKSGRIFSTSSFHNHEKETNQSDGSMCFVPCG